MPFKSLPAVLIAAFGWNAVPAEEAFTPLRLPLRAEATFRVQSFARERTIVKNPVNGAQFRYRVPEGTRVEEGDLLFVFDMSVPLEGLMERRRALDATRYRILQTQATQEDELRSLEEKIEAVSDEITLLEARQVYLLSLPRAEDIEIAHGRLNIAEQNHTASTAELERAKGRHTKGLLSAVELAKAERDVQRKLALYAFAQKQLEYDQLPATQRSIRILTLRLENERSEHSNLQNELEKKKRIMGIKKVGSDADLAREQARLDEQLEELEHEKFLSPASGVVIYTERFKRMLATGGRTSKGTPLLELADESSIAFQGGIPERLRPWFQPGATVDIVLNSAPDRVLKGSLQHIRSLPRDAAEGERMHYGEEAKTTGVKVYDVEVIVEDLPEEMRIGNYGAATLYATEQKEELTVPADFVRMIEGKAHLARNGRFEEVKGSVYAHWFILSDPSWEHSTITRDGELPQRESGETNQVLHVETDNLVATGELYPGESIRIQAPRNHGWDMKFSFIAPEDSFVKKGDRIAELESERLTKRAKDFVSQVQMAQSSRKAAEEMLDIAKEESSFDLNVARNLMEIKKLEWEIAELGVDALGLFQAELSLTQATLDVEAAKELRDRGTRNPEAIAQTELIRREREVERKTFQKEAAEIRLQTVRKGNEPLAIQKAKLAFLKQKTSVANLEKSTRAKVNQATFQRDNAVRGEERNQRRSDRNEKHIAMCTLEAPTDGLLKYEKLWDGSGISKIDLGRGSWPGAHILSISDSSRMSVRLSVPERAFQFIKPDLVVEVRIPSLTQQVLPGRIEHIANVLEPLEEATVRAGLYANHEPSQDQVIHLRIAIDAPEELELKPGAIAHVVFPFSIE